MRRSRLAKPFPVTLPPCVPMAIRSPSPHLGEISADLEAIPKGSLAQLITHRRVPDERLRINITIDKGLLRVADEAAEAAGLTRSGFIERALEAATGESNG